MEKLYDDLIKQLIEIGRSEIIPPSTEMNIRLRESREQISPSINIINCDNFSTADLKLLYKGLVLSEKELKWMDGSATKTARLLQMLNERFDFENDYQDIKELYEFGFANRGHNDYVPTGTGIHYACVTFEDYLEVNRQKAINTAKHDEKMLREQKESRRMKAIKKEFKEQRAKQHVERKKERDKNIVIIEK
jgi:hypothetical protein